MKALSLNQSKAMANVKVFSDEQTDKRTGQKVYVPDLLLSGIKMETKVHIKRYIVFYLIKDRNKHYSSILVMLCNGFQLA